VLLVLILEWVLGSQLMGLQGQQLLVAAAAAVVVL
jgi:hypothetical protein